MSFPAMLRKIARGYFQAWICFSAVCSSAQGAETISYPDLGKRLTDLGRLAILPPIGEKQAMASSYDRGSKYESVNDKYVSWGTANGDGTGFVRMSGKAYILAEMQGPGVIWRIWSAQADTGHVRIYLDGSATPAIDMPFSQFFDQGHAPFNYKSLVYTASRGFNNYIPIPYQKSCRIEGDPGWGRYFHFNYTTYPAGTTLPAFKRELAAEDKAALATADSYLASSLGGDPEGARAGERVEIKTVKIGKGAGAVSTIASVTGPGAITSLWARLRLSGDTAKDRITLRELALRVYWDGESRPSVWAPLGDFFGSAPGYNKYASLPAGMTDSGFYCHWYMPFAKSATLQLLNDGNADQELQFTIVHSPLPADPGIYGRFHAKWHRNALLSTRADRQPDWTLLATQGRGRYVGVNLHVWHPKGGNFDVPQFGGMKWWWGEGDEKFFVDGEKFPSQFGTGTEDFFGYAWSNPGTFAKAYHAQPLNGNNKGHISDIRWQITDNEPFQSSFEGSLEKYFPDDIPALYAATAYWYLEAGGADPYGEASGVERISYWDPAWKAPAKTDWVDPYPAETRVGASGSRGPFTVWEVGSSRGSLEVDVNGVGDHELRITDNQGRVLAVRRGPGPARYAFTQADLTKGFCFLSLRTPGGTYARRVLISAD